MNKISDIVKKFDRDDYVVSVVVAVFVGSRLLMSAMGFELDARFLHVAWQNVDTYLLQTDLWRSIWYLHSQPPFFNLFLGVVLKLFPIHFVSVFQIVFHLLGLALVLCFYWVINRLTANRLLSFIFSLIFILSPSVILFEMLLFYDFPVLVILVAVLFFFQKSVQTNKTFDFFVFFLSAAFLVLFRRIYHLVWFLALVTILWYFYRHEWKRIILACLLPLVLIVFWYGKNWYYFGNFDASSWTGMGFFKTASYVLTQSERQELFDQGVVSNHIFYGSDPFQIPVATTTAAATFPKKLLAIPVVGNYTKKNGEINYNYYAYINLSRELKTEFLSILKHRPLAYFKGMAVTSIIFFSPGSSYFAASENNNVVDFNYQLTKEWDTLYNRFIYGQPLSWGGQTLKKYLARSFDIRETQAWRLLSPGVLFIAVYLVSFFYGLKIIFKKNSRSERGMAVYLTVIFLVMNIFYATAVGILAEAGENQRHRFIIEPFTWILFALFIEDVILKKRSKS